MAVIWHGRVCLRAFVLGFLIITIPFVGYLNTTLGHIISNYLYFLLVAYAAVVNGVVFACFKDTDYQVAVRACGVGLVGGISWMLVLSSSSYRLFGWYLAALSLFHFSEYYVTAVTNPRNLSLDSFLLDHSREYHLAFLGSLTEFTIEWYLFPNLKQPSFLSVLGLLLVIGGEVLRKTAMVTAMSNFNHYVQHVREEGHQLVTHGVYSMFRHPSYVGWFYWSIGTQIVLCNPVCIVGYTYASWNFFRHRIFEEEISLLNFFGEEYLDYQKQVKTGLPFIEGYRMVL